MEREAVEMWSGHVSCVGVADDSENLLIWPNHLLDMSTGFVWCSVHVRTCICMRAHCIYMRAHCIYMPVHVQCTHVHVFSSANVGKSPNARVCLHPQGGLGKTLDSTANDFMKATATVSRDVSNAVSSNPLVSHTHIYHNDYDLL